MSSTPWQVQRTKRKTPATEPPPRKRVRISDDVGRRKSSTAELRHQKTLTQIQWVNSPQTSLDEDTNFQEIGLEPANEERLGKGKRKRVGKRDSTLTQMDWLGTAPMAQEDDAEDMELLAQTRQEVRAALPQFDATYDSPRKKSRRSDRSRRTHAQDTPAQTHRDKSQRNKPYKQEDRTLAGGVRKNTTRRRSSRIASKLPAEAEETLKDIGRTSSPRKQRSVKSRSNKVPVLEVRDTMDSVKKPSPARDPAQPQTPRQRRVVPSSQTPETLPNTKRRLYHANLLSPSKSLERAPLRERSANIQMRTYSQGLEASKSMLGLARRTPRRSKVCVLKVPSKELLRRSGQTEDSQHDVFSFPETSSSGGRKGLSDPNKRPEPTPPRLLRKEESIEIPPTSDQATSSEHDVPSSPPVVDTQASLPELGDLFSVRKIQLTKSDRLGAPDSHRQANGDDSVLTHGFGRVSRGEKASVMKERADVSLTKEPAREDMLLDDEPPNLGTHAPSQTDQTTGPIDANSDLGSPVANDTQFNIGMLQRISSPSSGLETVATEILDRQKSPSGSPTPKRSRQTPSRTVVQQAEMDVDTPIPTPKLVQNAISSAINSQLHTDRIPASDNVLPSSDGYETVSTEPLNQDVQRPASSSPTLPPVRPTTQRSIHPASMPRPSQISTQAPTQGYFPSSAPVATQRPIDLERITIKDSSSVPPRLSQIPSNQTQTQGLRYNLRLEEDSDGEIDDLDLDPKSSTPRGRLSARKRYDMLRKDTASSLKSIHLPLSKSSQQIAPTQQSSSSPHLKPLMPPPRRKNVGRLPRDTPPKLESQVQDQPIATILDQDDAVHNSDPDLTSSPISSPNPAPLKKKHDPIPGFDNDTQSNFTQDGHVTAAYIHREREAGRLPDWFTPLPHQVPNWTGRAKDKRKSGGQGV